MEDFSFQSCGSLAVSVIVTANYLVVVVWVVFLWWCCGVLVVVFLWWCGGVFVVVFLWCCGGVFVAGVFGGVLVVRWCFCGGVV